MYIILSVSGTLKHKFYIKNFFLFLIYFNFKSPDMEFCESFKFK